MIIPGIVAAQVTQGEPPGPPTKFIAVAHDTSPRVTVYPWSGAGFGAKFANPTTLPTGISRSVSWSFT